MGWDARGPRIGPVLTDVKKALLYGDARDYPALREMLSRAADVLARAEHLLRSAKEADEKTADVIFWPEDEVALWQILS